MDKGYKMSNRMVLEPVHPELPWRLLAIVSSATSTACLVATALGVYPLAATLALVASASGFLAVRSATIVRTVASFSASNAELVAAISALRADVAASQARFDVFTTNFTAAQALGGRPQKGPDGHYLSPIRRG